MSNVITVENLGKKYTLHHQQREQYTALRDVIADSFKGVGRRLASVFNHSPFTLHPSQGSEDFWALKDLLRGQAGRPDRNHRAERGGEDAPSQVPQWDY